MLTLKTSLKKPTVVILLLLSIFSFSCSSTFKCWSGNKNPFFSDVDQYYSYLVALTLHQDLSFKFPNSYWLIPAPNGNHIPKVSMGMAYMYAPFFYGAHLYTSYFSRQPANAYSRPYADALVFAGILYTLLGLYFVRKILLIFFDEWPSALTLLAIYLGTNLLHYTLAWGLMPHNYLFFLFSIIAYTTIQWHQTLKLKYMIGLGFTLGLITVVRPAEILIAIFPLLYNVRTIANLKEKAILILKQKTQFLIALLVFSIPLIPQLIYWKWTTGSYFYYSYGDNEKFFFNDPKIFDFLFSYRKGWFMYTPIMILSIVGFFWRDKIKAAYLSVLMYTLVTIYFLSSWWCWWFGGGFGMRVMIESYAILALPLTAFFTYALQKKILRIVSIALVIGCIYLNFLQMYQYRVSTLHYDSMSKEVYWKIFGKWERTDEIIEYCEKHYILADYEKARKGIR